MIRPDFLLGCAAVTFPARALAQPALRKIGFVSWFTPEVAAHAETFRKGCGIWATSKGATSP